MQDIADIEYLPRTSWDCVKQEQCRYSVLGLPVLFVDVPEFESSEQFVESSEQFVALAGLNMLNNILKTVWIYTYNLSVKIYPFHVVVPFAAAGEHVLMPVA